MGDPDQKFSPDDIDVMRRLIADQSTRIADQEKQIERMDRHIGELDDYIRRLLRWRFGRRTEKSTEPQEMIAELLDLLAEDDDDLPPPPDLYPVKADKEGGSSARKSKHEPPPPKPGRRLPSEQYPYFPVVEERIEPPASERFDTDGHPLVAVGSETSEKLLRIPESWQIRRTIRVHYGRSDTGEKVTIAPVPPAIVPKGILANLTVLCIVIQHVVDCLPFNRISEQFQRSGVAIGRQTITASFHAFAQLAEPMLDAIQADLLQAELLHIDGSFMFRQDRRRRRCCTRSPVYAITDGTQLLMRWRPDETHESASDLIPGYGGILVCDQWGGWYQLDTDNPTIAGCLAHARRYFAEHQDTDGDARHMVNLIGKVYAVEQAIDGLRLTGQAEIDKRLQFRQSLSVGYMDDIIAFAQNIVDRCTGTKAGKAAYIIRHQDELRKFLSDGRIPPDNNLAERVLRRNAMIRKNRHFFVAENGGKHLAIAMSLTGSCRLLGICPMAYLQFALPALFAYRDAKAAGQIPPDLRQFTPAAFARQSSLAAAGPQAA